MSPRVIETLVLSFDDILFAELGLVFSYCATRYIFLRMIAVVWVWAREFVLGRLIDQDINWNSRSARVL